MTPLLCECPNGCLAAQQLKWAFTCGHGRLPAFAHAHALTTSCFCSRVPSRYAQVRDGSVTFTPSDDAQVRCCGGARTAKTWPSEDIVGAQQCQDMNGAAAVQLYLCPIKHSKGGRVVRQLRTEAPFVASSADPESAMAILQAVRRTLDSSAAGVGGGRIVIVSNSNAGRGRCGSHCFHTTQVGESECLTTCVLPHAAGWCGSFFRCIVARRHCCAGCPTQQWSAEAARLAKPYETACGRPGATSCW